MRNQLAIEVTDAQKTHTRTHIHHHTRTRTHIPHNMKP